MGSSLAQHLQGLRLEQRACLVTSEDELCINSSRLFLRSTKDPAHIHYCYGPHWCLRTELPLRAFSILRYPIFPRPEPTKASLESQTQTSMVNRLPLPVLPLLHPPPLIPPPFFSPKPILYSVKNHRPFGCQGNQAFYSVPVTGWLGLRSRTATGAQTFGAPLPTMPPCFPKEGGGLHPSCLFAQAQLGETGALGLSGVPWLPLGEISAPQPSSGPGPFQRTIASTQGKIPSPRVQVSKELLGPLFSLEWALRRPLQLSGWLPPSL